MTMILFESEGVRFNLRVGGVALSESKALLQYTELDTFWVVPGGRVEMMEPATDALKREIAEELGEPEPEPELEPDTEPETEETQGEDAA